MCADTSVADVLEANLVWWVLQVLVEHVENTKLVRNVLLVLAAMAALNGTVPLLLFCTTVLLLYRIQYTVHYNVADHWVCCCC